MEGKEGTSIALFTGLQCSVLPPFPSLLFDPWLPTTAINPKVDLATSPIGRPKPPTRDASEVQKKIKFQKRLLLLSQTRDQRIKKNKNKSASTVPGGDKKRKHQRTVGRLFQPEIETGKKDPSDPFAPAARHRLRSSISAS